MVINYEQTKIYKLYSHLGPKIYIGATTKRLLSQRAASHRYNYNNWIKGRGRRVRSFDLFEEYGTENCTIELIEAKSCTNKNESAKLEGEHIKKLQCVNKNIAGRTEKEYIDDNKDTYKLYREANKDKFKQYRIDHKEENTEYKKLYYIENKEQIAEKAKAYYLKNQDKIKEKKECSCGGHYISLGKYRHERTKKHCEYMKLQHIE